MHPHTHTHTRACVRVPTHTHTHTLSYKHTHARTCTQVHPAPGPEEVNWQALNFTYTQRMHRALVVQPLLLLLIAIPIGLFAGALMQLSFLFWCVCCRGQELRGLCISHLLASCQAGRVLAHAHAQACDSVAQAQRATHARTHTHTCARSPANRCVREADGEVIFTNRPCGPGYVENGSSVEKAFKWWVLRPPRLLPVPRCSCWSISSVDSTCSLGTGRP